MRAVLPSLRLEDCQHAVPGEATPPMTRKYALER